PALTLGLEPPDKDLMRHKPVKRSSGIVGAKTLWRIIISGVFVGGIMLKQYTSNFLGVAEAEKAAATFTLFIFFQLFNAFNCRELGTDSIFKNIGKNKVMVATFFGVFLVHFFIVQAAYKPFGLSPMCALSWLKCLALASSILVFSELGKAVYRFFTSGGLGGNKTFAVRVNKNQIKA
ncbi:MAG: cation transporting ATPase C-terminal domain-containing protein, partial [Clostridia bacterium]|nr:cation transporting ATPase C-terminal domain-containing protein [Clostridia bacterium]